jgi:hypothetical protein
MHSDLGLLVIRIHCADGRDLIISGGYFTNPYWWWAQLHWGPGNWRYLGNDNENPSAEPEPFPNVAPCAWPADLLSLLDRPVLGTVNERP